MLYWTELVNLQALNTARLNQVGLVKRDFVSGYIFLFPTLLFNEKLKILPKSSWV